MTTDQQILDEAKASLLRILQSDSASWSESERQQNLLEINRLQDLIDRYESKVASASGRRIMQPIRRVNL